MEEERYIQIGVTAARDPSGNFLPAVPVFAPITPSLEAAEARHLSEVGSLFAAKMKQYIDAGGKIKKSSRSK